MKTQTTEELFRTQLDRNFGKIKVGNTMMIASEYYDQYEPSLYEKMFQDYVSMLEAELFDEFDADYGRI